MTTDDILRMAREAGMDRKPADHNCRVDYFDVVTDSELERFAALVAAAEREQCAKVCEAWAKGHAEAASSPGDECDYTNCDLVAASEDCAHAIRARGKT